MLAENADLAHEEVPEAEQRVSIIDSSIMKAQENSQEMLSTQQTSEEVHQSDLHRDSKLKN